jgi:hypothetical protein
MYYYNIKKEVFKVFVLIQGRLAEVLFLTDGLNRRLDLKFDKTR